MKYIIESIGTGYLQFISLPEAGDTWAYPQVAQIRGNMDILYRLKELIIKACERLDYAETHYYDKEDAKAVFDFGEVISSPGSPILVAVMQARQLNVFALGTVLFEHVCNRTALIAAIDRIIKKETR
jgi:hypothetical protein